MIFSTINCESLVSREYAEALEREMTERDNEHVTQLLLDEAQTVVRQATFLELGCDDTRFLSSSLTILQTKN